MSWLRWLRMWLLQRLALCMHDWREQGTTYAPPRVKEGNFFELTWLEFSERERAVHGCTSTLRRCEKCGAREVIVMLGRSDTGTDAKVIPINRAN